MLEILKLHNTLTFEALEIVKIFQELSLVSNDLSHEIRVQGSVRDGELWSLSYRIQVRTGKLTYVLMLT